ncbi:ATP-binding protein [Pseudonocardia sp. DSM 110487]|uniref:protein DpdH n=1 Tax=Pseudonocardia sp. DSM 110487 TaxID=2865833 RepID=UPI001C6A8950|nr:protein DpdH [Pseudonocardia sp. DSM 110487]QYN37790.1 ATP-binding protein [Pseudonocardia sp. DSM 110487]
MTALLRSPVGDARELRRVVCWDRQQVTATIATEAVSPSKPVFFATHTPLRIQRTGKDGVRSDTPGPTVDEAEVARDFLTRDPVNGALLMPVIGQSGTGKSHLVRWVKERMPESDRRHVIYLPKSGTSLKSLLTNLLADRTDGPLAALRDQVASMTSGMDRAALQQRLLNGLQEAVVAAEPTSPEMRRLAGPGRLETLLLDPYVREHMLQPDGLIARMAASQLTDGAAEAHDRPLEFTVDDLPLDLSDVRQAAAATQRMLVYLRTGDKPQQLAVALLNQALGSAVANAANLGSGRLSDALLQVRRQLAAEGREIVLLVEDFALIQGVQRELLEAVIEAGIRGGRTEYAPIRTLLAVTTGYYRNLVDTALTRAQAATPYVYDLDVQFDGSPAGLDEVEGFVGRYLNAARLGRTVLDAAGDDPDAKVPNACKDCQLRAPCHAGFGASTADPVERGEEPGYGLYPFNRPALHRAILARAPEGRPDAFNPRAVIGQVIRSVLLEHASAITEGTFPDERFTERFPTQELDLPVLPVAVSAELERLSPADAPRRAALLEFWGDAPGQVTNLDPVIHDAFGIPPLRLDDAPESTPPAKTSPSRAPGSRPARTASTTVKTSEIEDWGARQRQLPTNVARDLRRIVRTAVVQRTLWLDPLMAEPLSATLDRVWPVRSSVVSIEEAESENDPRTAQAPIRFDRTPANAEFLQGLLALARGDARGNPAAVRRLADLAEKHRPALIRRIQEETGSTDAELVPTLRVALLGAALAGRVWPGADEATLLAAALNDGAGWVCRGAELRTPAWREAWGRHRAQRPELVDRIRRAVGISRGRGDVRMIDAVRATRLLRLAAAEPWGAPAAADVPDWVRPIAATVTTWDTLVPDQFRQVESTAMAIRRAMPAGTAYRTLLARLREAFEAAVAAGLLVGELTAIEDTLDTATDWGWDALRLLHDDVADAQRATAEGTLNRAVARAAIRDRGADLPRITRLLADADEWLSYAAGRAEKDPRTADDIDHALAGIVDRWKRIGTAR